jgi:hypothetical protein
MSLHTLAENLSMTVTRLKSEMTWNEYQDWILFYQAKNSEQDNNLLNSPESLLKGFGL